MKCNLLSFGAGLNNFKPARVEAYLFSVCSLVCFLPLTITVYSRILPSASDCFRLLPHLPFRHSVHLAPSIVALEGFALVVLLLAPR